MAGLADLLTEARAINPAVTNVCLVRASSRGEPAELEVWMGRENRMFRPVLSVDDAALRAAMRAMVAGEPLA